MRAQHSTKQRKNRAYRVADWPAIQRIHSAPVLRPICNAWAYEQIDALSRPAKTLLRFLAALNRSGDFGYCGVAVVYYLLAEQISTSTDIPFSKRSLERAVHDLKQAGLIDVSPWVREAQYFRSGKRNVFMCGAGTVKLKNGAVVTRRLAILTLTDAALAMWEAPNRRTKPDMSHTVNKDASPAKMADRSSKPEKIDKSIILTEPPTEVVNTSEVVNVIEGHPTRSGSNGRCQTVKHHASTSPESSPDTVTAPTGQREADHNSVSPCPPSCPPQPTGCAQARPTRGPQQTDFRSIARVAILGALWDCLSNHSKREASSLYSRAKYELDELPPGWSTAVDWDYWLDHWRDITPTARQAAIRLQILPTLKQCPAAKYTPHDRRKVVRRGADEKHQNQPITDPLLRGLIDRLGLSDRFD